MDMTGERRIPASREAVWAALNDPAILKACIPGCESLEAQSPTEMTARVKLQIGPVKATFNGSVKLSDLDPPSSYRISGQGSGGVAGHAKGNAAVRLEDDGEGTRMTYEVKAEVGGKIAQLGSRLIDATAKKLADQFFERFCAGFAAEAEEASPEAPAEGSAAPAPAAEGAAAPKKRGLGRWFRWLRPAGKASGPGPASG